MQINELFSGEIKVVNMGLTAFNDAIAKQGLKGCQVDWKPPADPQVYALLDALDDEKVDAANREAVRRINAAEPVWYDVVRAGDVIPELDGNVIGHAGPDLAWEEMCGPLKGAILGAAVYEGMAEDLDAAERMAQRGEIRFLSNHAIGCVGPMTGMITKSMPLVAVPTTLTATPRTVHSMRAWARSCASVRTARRFSNVCAGWRRCLARH